MERFPRTNEQEVMTTPRYVLMKDRKPIRPTLKKGQQCTAMYGFSDKRHYDNFLFSCSENCTPYPLTKVHLKNIAEQPSAELKLILLDAGSLNSPTIMAATIDEVLDAHLNQRNQIPVTYKLFVNPKTLKFQVEKLDVLVIDSK